MERIRRGGTGGMGEKFQPESSLILVTARVSRSTAGRVASAARQVDQPMSAWLRMAIMEKLARDGG